VNISTKQNCGHVSHSEEITIIKTKTYILNQINESVLTFKALQ